MKTKLFIRKKMFSERKMYFTLPLAPVLIGLLLLSSIYSYAATKTSAATGNWNAAATWTPAGVPTSTDDVIIHGGHTITIDSIFTCHNLDLGDALSATTTTLTITVAGNSLNITGDLRINPVNYAKTFYLDAGPGSISVSGTFSTWGTAGTNSIKVGVAGVLTFTPAITISSTAQNITFSAAGTVNFNSSFTDNYNKLVTYASCIVNFNSSYTVNTTAASWASKGTAYFSNTGSITANSNLTLYNVQFNSSAATTLANAAGTVIIGGTVTLSSGSYFTCSKDIEVDGATWTNNGGTLSATGTTITINGSTVSIGGTSPTAFATLQIGQASSAATKAVTMNNNSTCTALIFSSAGRARTLTVASGVTFNINGDVTINQNTANYTNTLATGAGICNVSGNLIFSGTDNTTTRVGKVSVTSGAFTLAGSVTWMNDTVAATEVITVSTGSITFGTSLSMPSGSGTVSVTSTGTINFNGTTAPSLAFGGVVTSPVFTTGTGSTVKFAKGFTNNTNAIVFGSTSTAIFTGNGAITPNANITFGKVQINALDTLNAGAGVVKVAGAFTLSSGATFTTNQNIELDGNWVNNGGTLNATGDTVILNGTAQAISGTSPTAFSTLQVGNSTAVTVVCTMNNSNSCNTLLFWSYTKPRTFTLGTGYTLTISGDLTINQNTAAYTSALNVNGGTCTVGGNLVFNGTTNTTTYVGKVAVTTGSFSLSGNVTWMSNTAVATEVISVTTGTLTFANSLTMSTGSGTLTVSGAATVNFNGTSAPSFNFGGTATSPSFTTAANCTLNFKAGFTNNSVALTLTYPSTAVFTGTGTITPNAAITFASVQISSGATVTAGGNMSVKGNWTNNGGTFTPSTYIVTLNAASPNTQTITKSGGETFYKLTISTTGTTIVLGNDVTITNTLTMSAPNINLNGYTLTLGSGAGATLTRTAGIAYGGTWRRWFPASAITSASGSFYGLFPIGTSTDYRPVAINTTVAPTGAGYVSASHTDATSVTLVTYTDNEAASIQDIADMKSVLSTSSLTGGTYSIDVAFTGFTSAGATTDLKLETYTSNTMGSVGTSATTTGTVVNPTVKRTGLTLAQLSNTFVVASKNKTNTPLRAFYYSRKTGNWNDATVGNGTWSYTAGGSGASCDCTPSGTGYVIISTGQTVTINTNAAADYLDINSGATLVDNGTNSLTVNRDMTLNGTGTFTNTSTWTVTSNMNFSASSSPTGSGTFTSNGTFSLPYGGSYSQTSGTLNIAANAAILGTLSIGTATLNFNGSGNLSGTTGSILSTGLPTINMSNSKTILAGANLVIGSNSAPVTFAITGNTTMTNYGTIKIYGDLTGTVSGSTWTNLANASLEVTGNLLATGTLNASASPNTVKYSGSGSQTIKAPASSYYDLVIANSGTKSFASNITADDAITVSGSAVLDMSTYTLSGNADLNMSSTGELKLQRSISGTYPGINGDFSLTGGTVTINQTAGTCTLQNGAYYNVKFTGSRPYDLSNVSTIANNFDVQGSSTLINNIPLTIGGTFTYSSSGSSTLNDDISAGGFTLSSGTVDDGGNTVTISGAGGWNHNGGTFTTTGLTAFTGSVSQQIAGSLPTTFNTLQMNGSGGVTLNVSPASATIINSALILTNGKIYTTATNILRIVDGANSSSGSSSSFVSGPMVKVGNDDFIFPVGKGANWRRVGVSGLSDATSEVTAEYFASRYTDTLPVIGRIHKVSPKEYWMVDRAVSTDSLKLRLFWEGAYYSTLWDCQRITVAHWTNSAWREEAASPVSGSSCTNWNSTGSLQTTGYISSFSPFTFGGNSNDALPVKLVSFDATPEITSVRTNWTTELEFNNNYFTVERSTDAREFTEIGRVNGAGNSTEQKNYEWTDENPLPGVTYYRLKQTDFNGEYSYSDVVPVRFNPTGTFKVYPNPAHNNVYISLLNSNESGKLYCAIYNMEGREVLTRQLETEMAGVTQIHSISIENILPPGMYFVSVTDNNGNNYREKLVVK